MGQKISETKLKEEIRSVVRENIKEVTTNDWHYKAIMSIWDKGGSFTRKKIGAVLCGDPNANRRDVEEALRDSDYSEVTDVTDRLRIEGVIKEAVKLTDIESDVANLYAWDGIKTTYSPNTVKDYGQAVVDMAIKLAPKVLTYQKKLKSIGKDIKNSKESEILKAMISFSKSNRLNADTKVSIEDLLFYEGIIKEGEDNIPGGLAKGMTLNDIAEKHGVSVDVLVAEFKKGIQTEMEHTTDREMAKEITMDHLFEDPQYYTKLATVEEYVDDKGVEHVAAALPQTEEEPLKEATANANILGIDFNINETDGDIMFSFKDKTAGSIKVREIGSNKIVNLIQNSLDKAYGKGSYFFKSGKNAEIIGGYLFKKNESNINLNKLKFESIIKEEDYNETPEETLEGLKEMAMGNLERIADYANMISQRMGEGQNLESWMYSQLTIALENLNTVHDAMDGTDGKKEEIKEEKVYIDYLNKQKGFKQDRIKFNSYEEAVKWARKNFEKFNPDMIKYESINELTSNEKQIKTGNPANVFYAFYKGKFAAQYWAMNSSDLFNMFWNEFKVRRPAGSQFKLNPEFIIVSKKEYDRNPNHYAKLKPYVDKFWDKLQNESVNEATGADIISQIKDIAKNHQNNTLVDPKTGKKMRVDAFSASAIATVYDALSDSSKEKFLQSGLLGMQAMAMKLLKK